MARVLRECPTGGRCPSSPSCPHYAHERRMSPNLAWCLRDLPRGVELTQSEAAASIGISERQLRRLETTLVAALREVRVVRELWEHYFSIPGAGAPDVRSADANGHDGEHAAHVESTSPSPGVDPTAPRVIASRRARHLPRRFPGKDQ